VIILRGKPSLSVKYTTLVLPDSGPSITGEPNARDKMPKQIENKIIRINLILVIIRCKDRLKI